MRFDDDDEASPDDDESCIRAIWLSALILLFYRTVDEKRYILKVGC